MRSFTELSLWSVEVWSGVCVR